MKNDLTTVYIDQLRSLIAAHKNAADQVANLTSEVRRRGRLDDAWTQDVVSVAMKDHFNAEIIDNPHSSYASLINYGRQLRDVIEALEETLRNYEVNEVRTAAQIGRL